MAAVDSITIVGVGAMGGAIARAVVKRRIIPSSALVLIERDPERARLIASELGVRVQSSVDAAVGRTQMIIVAVKPQDFQPLAAVLSPLISAKQEIVSIMAGVRLATLSSALGGHRRLVRSMPNLPARCGVGMTTYVVDETLGAEEAQRAQLVFESFGRSLQVTNEDLLDAATAISGTGPAYFFFLLEQLVAVSIELGFSEAEAELLLQQTMAGASALWNETAFSPAKLIREVASRGGTTEAALQVYRDERVAEIMQDAVRAAYARSRQLNC